MRSLSVSWDVSSFKKFFEYPNDERECKRTAQKSYWSAVLKKKMLNTVIFKKFGISSCNKQIYEIKQCVFSSDISTFHCFWCSETLNG